MYDYMYTVIPRHNKVGQPLNYLFDWSRLPGASAKVLNRSQVPHLNQ